MRRILALIAFAVAVVVVAPSASASDADLLRGKCQQSLIYLYAAVSSEGSGVTDHAKRVTVATNFRDNADVWAARLAAFVVQQSPTYADTCVGDAEGHLTCTNTATQSNVDGLASSFLTINVGLIP